MDDIDERRKRVKDLVSAAIELMRYSDDDWGNTPDEDARDAKAEYEAAVARGWPELWTIEEVCRLLLLIEEDLREDGYREGVRRSRSCRSAAVAQIRHALDMLDELDDED